ncbi:MAG: histone [Promethearchaeati archaeon SRVP18_Atabeyarchaeia-1]
MPETILPKASVDRIIRKAGAERVGDKASVALAVALEEIGLEISRIARELSEHANRKTITDKDVRLAYSQWKRART